MNIKRDLNEVSAKKNIKIDDKEDLEIKNVAYTKNKSGIIFLIILIAIFGLALFSTIMYIVKFYDEKPIETIKLNNSKNRILITNNGIIEEKITNNYFKDKQKEKTVERINAIEIEAKDEEAEITFNVKYNISKNTFKQNTISSNKSNVLLRIAYSFDNKNWTYINNVISTDESNLSSLMGNYYDIAGIISNLKIATNYKLELEKEEKIKMYWKSETIIKNNGKNIIDKEINADFKIEYKN